MSEHETKPNDAAYPSLGENGLTKREYLAAMAMQGRMAGGHYNPKYGPELAIEAADALIAKLNSK